MTPSNPGTKGTKTAVLGRRPGKPRSAPRRGTDTESARFYYKGSRLKQLRAFCYAVKFGTVVRAAESLFLSPS